MPRSHGVARYLLVASLVRAADGGAAVGLITLAGSMPGQPGGGAGTGGLLAALLTAPQLLGPLLARALDGARDDRRLLAVAFLGFGAALAGAALTLGRTPVIVPAVLVCLAGLAGPLLTGGLSAKLAPLAAPQDKAQRRAEGWDAITYGLGTTLGPVAVAGLAVAVDPRFAVCVLAASAVAAAVLVWTLPPGRTTEQTALPVIAALRAIAGTGPLRRTLAVTMLIALGTGGFAVAAVLLGARLHPGLGSGAGLNAAYGLGGLVGGFAIAGFPLQGEPERRVVRLAALSAAVISLCALSPGYGLALLAFAVAGVVSAVLFTASLAVRSTYSPPGARGQVFVAMAGLKMVSASAGTAMAGALAGWGPRWLLAVAAVLAGVAALVAIIDRRWTSAAAQQRGIQGQPGPEGKHDRVLAAAQPLGDLLQDDQHRR